MAYYNLESLARYFTSNSYVLVGNFDATLQRNFFFAQDLFFGCDRFQKTIPGIGSSGDKVDTDATTNVAASPNDDDDDDVEILDDFNPGNFSQVSRQFGQGPPFLICLKLKRLLG